MVVKKNEIVIGTCVDYSNQGFGMVKIEGFCIFVKNLMKGEKAKIKVTALKKNYGYGIINELLVSSHNRALEKCGIASICGGCQLQHMDYEEQLAFKQTIIEKLLERNQIETTLHPIIEAKEQYRYRNKVQVPFGFDSKGEFCYGFYRNHSNEIITFSDCFVQSEESNQILKEIYEHLKYNPGNNELRHVLLKQMRGTQEIMVVFIARTYIIGLDELVTILVEKYPNIKSCILNINTRNDNVILGEKEVLLYGQNYVKDVLLGKSFLLSAKSFYQINSQQTEVLYQKVLSFANIQKDDTVLDLYGGIGTIGILASDYAKKVISVEVVAEAIKNGKENAILNQVTNMEFFHGDVKDFVNECHEKVDIIVVDPPRKGIDAETIKAMIEIEPEKIVYVSCDPNTLVRDLKLLIKEYEIREIQPMDLFPLTIHTEVIVLLQREK